MRNKISNRIRGQKSNTIEKSKDKYSGNEPKRGDFVRILLSLSATRFVFPVNMSSIAMLLATINLHPFEIVSIIFTRAEDGLSNCRSNLKSKNLSQKSWKNFCYVGRGKITKIICLATFCS